MTTNVVFGPRTDELYDPKTEQFLIGSLLERGRTDMMCFNETQGLIQLWVDEGGEIATHDGRMLDMERAGFREETRMYDVFGKPIVLKHNRRDEREIYLVPPFDAFGASPRRSINRMRAKVGRNSQRCVSCSNLSRLFWLYVADRAFDEIMK